MFVCKLLNLKHYFGTSVFPIFFSILRGANGPKQTTALETFEIIIIQLTQPIVIIIAIIILIIIVIVVFIFMKCHLCVAFCAYKANA